jgi:hypothetical protein
MAGANGAQRGGTRRPARPAPEPSADFAHLTIDALRAYRKTLTDEESRVSYWRRLIQSRLDVLQAGEGGEVAIDALRDILGRSTLTGSRLALAPARPVDDLAPLPDIGALWSTPVNLRDPQAREELVSRLAEVEAELSSYRKALHDRMATATAELIARYREDPSRCLIALPLAPAALA